MGVSPTPPPVTPRRSRCVSFSARSETTSGCCRSCSLPEMGCWRPSYGHDACVGLGQLGLGQLGLGQRLGALYGGRHLRTTLVLALASAAAGGLTGAVGVSVGGAAASHNQPSPAPHSPVPKHRHSPTTKATLFGHPRQTPRHTPTPTRTASPQPTRPSTLPTTSAPA